MLLSHPAWENTRTVLFFAPLSDEPDIWPAIYRVIRGGCTVTLPSFDKSSGSYLARVVRDPDRDVKLGHHGIREPKNSLPEFPLNLLDLVLVPGVAFDMKGRRLGRGAGYYDRILENVPGFTCGIAFDEQISGELPVEPHDVLVDCILTPTRLLLSRAKRVD